MARIVITCKVTGDGESIDTKVDVGRSVPGCHELADAIARGLAAPDGEVDLTPKAEPPTPVGLKMADAAFVVAPAEEVAGETQKTIIRQEPTS